MYDRRMKRAVVLVVAGLVCAAAGAQTLYRWVDETGRVRFSDRAPPASAKGVERKAVETAPKPVHNEPYVLQRARREHPVTLYTSPDCGESCASARGTLNARGIPFAEISVAGNERLDELKQVSGGTGVPVMVVGKAVHKGFEAGLYERALDAAGYPAKGILPVRNQAAAQAPKPAPEAPKPAADEAKPAAGPLGPYAPRFQSAPPAASPKK